LILVSCPIITRTHAFIVACEPENTKNKQNPRTFHKTTSDIDDANDDKDDDDNDDDNNNNNNNNNHNYHSSTTEKLQQYTDLKEELKTASLVPQVLPTAGVIPNKLHGSLKLLNLRLTLYILTLLAAVLNTCCIVGKVLAKQ